MKKIFFASSVLLLVLFLHAPPARADAIPLSLVLSPSSGGDATAGVFAAFGTSDIAKLSASDDSRIQSNGNWPTGAYDEAAYIEYDFSGTLPADATISSVAVTHEFRRTGSLAAAKLEVWDSAAFADAPLTTGIINTDHADIIDISALIHTPAQANALKLRFLAYRASAGNTQTSHDAVSVSILYTMPDGTVHQSDPPPPPNQPPVASDMTVSTDVETPISITVSAADPENDTLTYSIASSPGKGTLGPFVGNRVVYSPSGQTGTDTFTFKASDGTHDSAVATVSITLGSGPVARITLAAVPIVLNAGEYATLTATGYDRFGNVAANDSTSQVLFSVIGTHGASYINGISRVAFVNGVAKVQATADALSGGVVQFLASANALDFWASGHAAVAYAAILADIQGSTTIHLPAIAGTKDPSRIPFTDAELRNVAVNDEFSTPAGADWPRGEYDEDAYTEFDFSTDRIPAGAVPDGVFLTVRYGNAGSVSPIEKLEVWNGEAFVDLPIANPAAPDSNATLMVEITPHVATGARAGKIKVRFLGRRETLASSSTTFNLVGIDLSSHLASDSLPPPEMPLVSSSSETVTAVHSKVISLSGHDSHGYPLEYSIAMPPAHGTLSAVAGNRVTYTPNGAIGQDSFSFTASNSAFVSAPASVAIGIVPGPVARLEISAPASADAGTLVPVTVTARDAAGNIASNSSAFVSFSLWDDAVGILGHTSMSLVNGAASTTLGSQSSATVSFGANVGSVFANAVVAFSAREESQSDQASELVSPAPPSASVPPGTYSTAQTVALYAEPGMSIRYSLAGSGISCATGTSYSGPITVAATKTLSVIACTPLGRASAVAPFAYVIVPAVQSNTNSSGSGTAATAALPEAPAILPAAKTETPKMIPASRSQESEKPQQAPVPKEKPEMPVPVLKMKTRSIEAAASQAAPIQMTASIAAAPVPIAFGTRSAVVGAGIVVGALGASSIARRRKKDQEGASSQEE